MEFIVYYCKARQEGTLANLHRMTFIARVWLTNSNRRQKLDHT